MRYDQIVLTSRVSIPYARRSVHFRSAPVRSVGSYSVGFGQQPMTQSGIAGHLDIPPNGAAHIINLLSCAAVVYIYTNGQSMVQNVVLYHSHTGIVPDDELPTDPARNVHRVLNSQIQVVFASSQSMQANTNADIKTAADGLIAIHNAGVPKANIRVVTGANGSFGANGRGEVGAFFQETWANGDLHATLTNVATQALADYTAQFPPGQTKLGFLGSDHNLTKGRARIQAFSNALNAANNDTVRLNAMQTLLHDAHSFKAGSLKLFVVKRLYEAIRHQPMTNVTTQNAQNEGNTILNGIRGGTL